MEGTEMLKMLVEVIAGVGCFFVIGVVVYAYAIALGFQP